MCSSEKYTFELVGHLRAKMLHQKNTCAYNGEPQHCRFMFLPFFGEICTSIKNLSG